MAGSKAGCRTYFGAASSAKLFQLGGVNKTHIRTWNQANYSLRNGCLRLKKKLIKSRSQSNLPWFRTSVACQPVIDDAHSNLSAPINICNIWTGKRFTGDPVRICANAMFKAFIRVLRPVKALFNPDQFDSAETAFDSRLKTHSYCPGENIWHTIQ